MHTSNLINMTLNLSIPWESSMDASISWAIMGDDGNTTSVNMTALAPASPCVSSDVTFNFYVNFVIIGTLCVCGLVGNTLSILVLQREPHHKVAIFLLQALAVADNLLLLVALVALSLWTGLLPYLNPQDDWIHMSKIYLPIIIDPIGSMAQTAMVWLTVLLALNRFIAVCKPFRAPKLCSLKRAKIQVMLVVLFSVCFNIPRFFQYRITWTHHHNGTAPDVDLEPSDIGKDSVFGMVYTNALYSILVLLLPLLLLIILNTQLVRELRASRKRAAAIDGRYGMPVASPDENISIIMIFIIIVFIVCQTPDRLYQVLNVVIFSAPQCNTVKSMIQAVCNLFIIINSSTNFLIYYVFRRSFRSILRQRICTMPGFRFSQSDLSKINIAELLPSGASDGNSNGTVRRIPNGAVNNVANNPLLVDTR